MRALRFCRLAVVLSVLLALTAHVLAMAQMRARLPAAMVVAPWALEICHGAGSGGFAVTAAVAGADERSIGHGSHLPAGTWAKGDCPLCSHQGTPVPTPHVAIGRLAIPGRPLLPALFLDAPDSQFAWPAQQPRAPPSFA